MVSESMVCPTAISLPYISFLQFNQQDEKHLKALSEVFGPHIPELVDRFHQHLQKFEETAPLLTDELIIKQVLESQRQYLEKLTQGNYNQHYAKERLKVGQAHNQIGLSPKWYTQRRLKLRFFSATAPWHALSSHLDKSAVSGHVQYILPQNLSSLLNTMINVEGNAPRPNR